MWLASATRQVVVLLAAIALVCSRQRSGARLQDSYKQFSSPLTPAPFTFLVDTPISIALLLFAAHQALPFMQDDERYAAVAPHLGLAMLLGAAAPWLSVAQNALLAPVLLAVLAVAFSRALANRFFVVIDHAYDWLVIGTSGALLSWTIFTTVLRATQLLQLYGIELSAEAAAAVILLLSFLQAALVIHSASSVFASVTLWILKGLLVSAGAGAEPAPLYAAIALGALVILGSIVLRLGGLLPAKFSGSTWGLSVAPAALQM